MPLHLRLTPGWHIDLNERGARRGGADRARRLTTAQCRVLYWAERGLGLDGIAVRLGLPSAWAVRTLIGDLEAEGVVAVHALDPAAAATLPTPGPRGRAWPAYGAHTLPRLWRAAQARCAERPWLVAPGGAVLTYAAGEAVVARAAERLRRLGVGKGERVALWAEPSVAAFAMFWAAMRLGIVVMPLQTTMPAPAARRLLERFAPALVAADAAHAGDLPALGRSYLVLDDDPADLAGVRPSTGRLDTDDLDAPGPDDTAVILFTSGTTGEPKGVALTQGALYRTSRLIAELYRFDADDALLSLGDFHAMSGLRNPLIVPLHAGARVVLPTAAARRSPLAAAELCAERGVSVLSAVPAFLKLLTTCAARLEPGTLAGLRRVLSTGAALTPHAAEAFRAAFGVPVHDYYGLTETCGACILQDPDDPSAERRGIGRAAGVIAQVVDAEDRVLPTRVVGELRVYGDNLMQGYVGQPELTRAVLRDGWLYTGDFALIDADGSVHLKGRKRDIVNLRDGDLVYVAEVERLIEEDEAVRDVAVCGYADARGDERLIAFVVPEAPDDGAGPGFVERLDARLRRRLDPSRLPERLVPVNALPRGTNGKVQKQRLLDEHGT